MLFYIVSVTILGAVTIWEMISVRGELVLSNGKAPETEIDRVKEVISVWNIRKEFSLDSIQKVTPSPGVRFIDEEDEPSSGSATGETP